VSIDTAMARIAALQSFMASPAPAPVAAPPVQATSFAATLAQATTAASGSYPHLTGDLDANPDLLRRLETVAASRGETWKITSGLRTTAEQQALWDARGSNPFPVARPGTSNHEHGNSADVSVNGRPIQDVVPAAELIRAGIRPLAGDAVHVDLA
jgi:D-alanyl-D-alanine carboxypeptidase